MPRHAKPTLRQLAAYYAMPTETRVPDYRNPDRAARRAARQQREHERDACGEAYAIDPATCVLTRVA